MKPIPKWLEELQKTLSSNLEDDKKFIKCFNKSVKSYGNVEKIKAPFLIFVLKSTLDKFDHTKYPDVKKVVDTVIGLYETGETDVKKFEAARTAAEAAAYAAASAAVWAAAVYAANAAWSAAGAAAEAAARASAYAATARTAEAAARQQEYEKFANYLLKLLKENEYTTAQQEISRCLGLTKGKTNAI